MKIRSNIHKFIAGGGVHAFSFMAFILGLVPSVMAIDWVEGDVGCEIAIDTRESIVVDDPDAVLPIAYSTNNWGAVTTAGGSYQVEILVNGQSLGVKSTNGYEHWQPAADACGVYKIEQRWLVDGVTDSVAEATVSYSVPARPLTIEADSESKEYDGKIMTADGFRISSGELKAGDTLSCQVLGEILDVGSTRNVIKDYCITRDGEDVTSEYQVTTVPGELVVTPVTETLEITANPPRVTDDQPNGFFCSEGVLATGDIVVAVAETVTNESGCVYCAIASYAVMRGAKEVTGNYTVVVSPSTIAGNENTDYRAIATSKEVPKVAKGEEVILGTEERPVVLDFQVKSASLTIGANATFTLNGEMWNANAIRISAGTKVSVAGKSVQTNTVAHLGVVEGMSSLTSGSFTDVTVDFISGTKKSNRVTVGSKSVFAAGDIDLGDGGDMISVGVDAQFAAGDLWEIETLAFGARSTNEIGNVVGLQKLNLAAGKAPTDKTEAIPTVLVAGDIATLTNKASLISLGKYSETSFGNVTFGSGNDKIAVGDNSSATFGRVDFGAGKGKDSLVIGKNCTLIMTAAAEECASLTKFTVGEGCVLYLSSELIAKGKELNGKYLFAKGSEVIDLGPAEVAQNFVSVDEERSDDEVDSARTLSGDVAGWLNDVKDGSGVKFDVEDYFVADRDMVIKVSLSEGNDWKTYFYINGKMRYFDRNYSVWEGDVIRIYRMRGDAPCAYYISAQTDEPDQY